MATDVIVLDAVESMAEDIVEKLGTGLPPRDMIAFTSQSTDEGIKLTFTPPDVTYFVEHTSGDGKQFACMPAGVLIRYSDKEYPRTTNDGVFGYEYKPNGDWDTESHECTIVGLTKDTKYYFTAFPYSTEHVYNKNQIAGNRTEMTWVGNKGTISVTVNTPEGYQGTLGEYTITLVDQAADSPQNIEKTVTGTGVTQFGGLVGGKSYKVRLSSIGDLQAPPDSEVIEVVAGLNKDITMTYEYRYGTLTVNINSDFGVNPINQVTVTLTPTSGGEAKTQSRQGTGAVSFDNLDAGEYTMSVSKIDLYDKPSDKSVTIVGGKTNTEKVTLKSSTDMNEYTVEQIINVFKAGKGNLFPVGSSKSATVYTVNLTDREMTGSSKQIDLILCEILNENTQGRFFTNGVVSDDYVAGHSNGGIEDRYYNFINTNRANILPDWSQYMQRSTTTYTGGSRDYDITNYLHYFSRRQVNNGITYFNSNSRRSVGENYFLLDTKMSSSVWHTYYVDETGAIKENSSVDCRLVLNFVIG